MTPPAVSVLMPCFNHGRWIDEAVDSVLAQTIQDFEIIIVDDGSTDPATVEKLSGYDRPRTRVLRTENRGLPAARNLAAQRATGRFYCALDADDRLAPTWFEKALAAFDRDPNLAFVSHWLQAFGDEEWLWRPERCELADLLTRNTVNGAALVRRETFEALGGFDETMRSGCEDWEFWLRAAENGYRGYIVPEVLYFYRRSAGSMSRLMLAGDGYRTAMQQLFDRHAETFRAYAVDAVVAKEMASLPVVLEIHRLERDRLTFSRRRLDRLREDAAALEQAAAATERSSGLASAPETPRAITPAVIDGLEDAARELRALREHEAALHSAVSALEREVRELRTSWSWKLTAPVRFVGAWFLK